MLDDDVMMQLGNAVLLGYCAEILKRRHWSEKDLVRERDRAEAGDRRDLHDALEFAGGLHPSLSSFADELSGNLASTKEVHAQWEALATSDDPIARLRLKDINFGDLDDAHLVSQKLKTARPNALRTPICQLGPTPLTRAIARLVIHHCREADEVKWTGEDLKQHEPKKKRRNPRDIMYQPAIDECLKRIRDSKGLKLPFPTAREVVAEWKVTPSHKWHKGCGKVPGASVKAAEMTLGKKVSTALKEMNF